MGEPGDDAVPFCAKLPDCMIGPSEPCNGYSQLRAEIERLRAEVAEWRQAAQVEANLRHEFYDEAERLRAALEWIVRECDALNKGPIAAQIARAALEEKK